MAPPSPADSAAPTPLALLAGRYGYLGELGRGATGRVLKVHDAVSGELRALKVVASAEAARLRWEFDLLASIAHPHVAAVHELLRLDERLDDPFRLRPGDTVLVEDLVEGETVDRVVDAVGDDVARRVALTLAIGESLARAVSAIHAAGMVHGDVKPQNVIAGADGARPVLLDLGLSRPPGFTDRVGGTPAYMAPEAWQGERSVATDLFAVGATLHRLLGGRPLLEDSRSLSFADVMRRALARPPASQSMPEGVPGALARLLDALLDPDPARRPGSARDVASRLGAMRRDDAGPGRVAGADDAPTAVERALAVRTLPFAGSVDALRELVRAFGRGGVIAVSGPAGSGRTRFVVEAVRRYQRARAETGQPVPTHVRIEGALPDRELDHDTILHVESADAVEIAAARALVRAGAVSDAQVVVVLERTKALEPAGDAAADAAVAIVALEDGALAQLLESAFGRRPSTALLEAARRASGGLAGRLCRLLADGWSSGRDPSRSQTLAELGAEPASSHAPTVPPTVRELAELLAAAGGELAPEALAMGNDPSPALAGLAQLVADGLATLDDRGRVHLRVDVARALRQALDPSRRAALVARVDPSRLDVAGWAFVAAARGEWRAAREAFRQAVADLRRSGDPEGAARLAEDAARELPDTPVAILVEHAQALRARGRYGGALAVLEGAAGAAVGGLRAEIHRLRGEAFEARELASSVAGDRAAPAGVRAGARATLARLDLEHGDLEQAEHEARRALAEADAQEQGVEGSRAIEVLVLVAQARGQLEQAARLAADAVMRCRRAGERAAEARARALAAGVALGIGRVRAGARGYADAYELAEQAGEAHAAATFLVNLGLARLDAGEPGPAMVALRDGARKLARIERDGDVARALYNLANAALLVGDDDVARAAVLRAREAASRAEDRIAAAFASTVEAELDLRAGEPARARRVIEAGAAEVGEGPPSARAVVSARRAVVLLANDRLEEAASAVTEADAAAEEASSEAAAVEWRVAAARLALRLGRGTEAREQGAHALEAAERGGVFEARVRAMLVLAEAFEAERDREGAGRLWSRLRSLLDSAAATLDISGRARLRALPAYRRALASVPADLDGESAGSDARWRTLARRAKRLTAERRLGRLYEEVLDAALDLAGAERGFFVVREREGTLRVRASRGIDRAEAQGALPGDLPEGQAPGRRGPSGWSRSIVARAIDEGRIVSTMDALADERLTGAASVHALALRSVVAVPLRWDGEVRAAVCLDDRLRPGAFGTSDVELLGGLADLASIAVEGAERLRAERRSARRLQVLRQRLARRVESQALEIESLRRATGGDERVAGIVARSEAMRQMLELTLRVADSDVPVLITGESGTGKELVARAIHARSSRRDAPFVSENCGAIPETLLESTLFGHVRGAFTGAERARVGLLEAAHGGTLLLDEVGEMSPGMQAKLLRVVQEGEVRPVGSERARRFDVRLVTATHRNLDEMVREATFREDLYYRLAVVVIAVPALRERPEDVPPLVAHFVEKHAKGAVRVDRRALGRLQAYRWPGNVRQLENEVQRALVLAGEVILEEHLSPTVRGDAPDVVDELDLKGQLELVERRLIRQALDQSRGNQTRAAKLLGVSRYGLQKMMKRLEIRTGG